MKNDRLMKILVMLMVGLISIGLYAVDEVSQEGVPYKAMVKTKVKLGEMVKKGQILFTVELAPLEIEKEVDKKDVIYTKDRYERDVFLHKHHAVKFADYLKAKGNYLAAVAALKTEELKIKHGTDTAPFKGEVTKIVDYTGSAVPDGGEVMDVTKTDKPIPITKPAVAQVMNRWEQPIIMKVKLGQKVKKGQLLFSTSTKELKLLLASDEEKLKLHDAYLKSITKNYKIHAVSRDAYETAKNLYAKALGAVKTDLDNIKESSSFSPFDGVVTNIISYSGSTLAAASDVVDVTKSPATSKK